MAHRSLVVLAATAAAILIVGLGAHRRGSAPSEGPRDGSSRNLRVWTPGATRRKERHERFVQGKGLADPKTVVAKLAAWTAEEHAQLLAGLDAQGREDAKQQQREDDSGLTRLSRDYVPTRSADEIEAYLHALTHGNGGQVVCATVADCAEAVGQLLPPGVPPGDRSWAFLGSSVMKRTFASVRTVHDVEGRWPGVVEVGGRCDRHAFWGVEPVPAEQWLLPEPGKEGPCHYGVDNPGCTECSGCMPWRIGDAAPSVEYLPVEFARDVELQTPTTKTTQETVALYLEPRPRDICVVSSGAHDLKIAGIPTEQFLENVAFYLRQLRRGCKQIVWVTMSKVMVHASTYPQTNGVIQRWNTALILRNFPEIAVVVDVYELSSLFSHVDHIHLETAYYDELAKAFPL